MLNYYGKLIFMYFLSPINVSISELDVHHLLLDQKAYRKPVGFSRLEAFSLICD